MKLTATVLDTTDPRGLALFYGAPLGWEIADDEEERVTLRDPAGGAGLSFQCEPAHRPPVWPAAEGDPRMMTHPDVEVTDLAAGVARALEPGARLAGRQPQADVRAPLDPAGHPFCLWAPQA
ncbi:VOC family protein [Actinosynnema pretiosum]|uniref:Glyoxalase n=1 Tax=Actinosynnema pretiosum TaxID=42197 RepID=A0A290Z7F8_9PSEU|nr:VOC family protein [Actinosynnema pretiosum]ATE54915.1 glyoxalase [Actinosynnema pretiosum]